MAMLGTPDVDRYNDTPSKIRFVNSLIASLADCKKLLSGSGSASAGGPAARSGKKRKEPEKMEKMNVFLHLGRWTYQKRTGSLYLCHMCNIPLKLPKKCKKLIKNGPDRNMLSLGWPAT